MDKTRVNSTLIKSSEKPKATGAPRGNKNAMQHGYYALKAKLNGADLDKRTAVYRALSEKETELLSSLGGDASPQQRIIVNDTVKHLLYAASLDRYLMQLKSLVRKGRVHGVLSERTRIGAHIRDNLKALGLERRTKTTTLADLLDEDNASDQPEVRQ